MMVIHLIVGVAVVICALGAAAAYVFRWPTAKPGAIAGWAVGLLVVQVATGMFLLTAGEEGPGPLHIFLPLAALAIAAGVRSVRSERAAMTPDGLLAAVYGVAAVAAAFALVSGLVAG